MKYILALAVVLLTSTTYAADSWVTIPVNNSNAATGVISPQNKGEAFIVRFNKTENCEAEVGVLNLATLETTLPVVIKGDFKMRVDTKPVWSTSKISVYQTSKAFMLYTIADEEFLLELMEGKYVRVKLNDNYNTFSLKGSKKTLLTAMEQCITTKDSYMPKEAEYFMPTKYVPERDFF